MNKWGRRPILNLFNIKSLLVLKRVTLVARFHTLMCEQGLFAVDKVKFDQVNNMHEEV